MRFTLTINCDNDAFAEDCNGMVADILADLANKVQRGEVDNPAGRTLHRSLCDINGNAVGHATYDRTGEPGYPRETLPATHWRYTRR